MGNLGEDMPSGVLALLVFFHIMGSSLLVGGFVILFLILKSMRMDDKVTLSEPMNTTEGEEAPLPRSSVSLVGHPWTPFLKRIIPVASMVLIISGVFLAIRAGKMHRDTDLWKTFFTVKLVTAMTFFFLGSCLVGRARIFDVFRRHSVVFTFMNAVLGICTVLMSVLMVTVA